MAAQQSKVGYKDLRDYLDLLESNGLLKHITAPVDLKYEVGGIAARGLDKGGDSLVGLMFENINGYEGSRLVTNILAKTEQLALAVGTEPDDMEIYAKVEEAKTHPIPPVVVPEGSCQEMVITGDDVDVYKFPTPWWHEGDAGPVHRHDSGRDDSGPEDGLHQPGPLPLHDPGQEHDFAPSPRRTPRRRAADQDGIRRTVAHPDERSRGQADCGRARPRDGPGADLRGRAVRAVRRDRAR